MKINSFKIQFILIIFFLLLNFISHPIFSQQAVALSTSPSKISMGSNSNPVIRSLKLKKWFTSKNTQSENFNSFQKYMKSLKIIVTPPLQVWINNRFFKSTEHPQEETWVLSDGSSLIIRHYSPNDPSNLKAEFYSISGSQLQYKKIISIIKFNPKDSKSFDDFKKELNKHNVVLRNYQMEELKENFFNASLLNQQYPNDKLLTWVLFTGNKLIVRFAREKKDLDFTAISIPYKVRSEKAWSLNIYANALGFSTTNEDVESYLNLGAGFTLGRLFYNSWGSFRLSNTGEVSAHIIENSSEENPNTYKFKDSSLIQQELGQSFQLFTTIDIYHDSNSGITVGIKALPGLSWNLLGYGNRFRFDPILSSAFGYRYEKDDITDDSITSEISYNEIILSHVFSVGNREYGGALFYWRLAVQLQHALLSSNSIDNEMKLYSPQDSYRLNLLAQFGFPLGNWKVFFTYLQEKINDQLQVTNKSGMLSFEAKIF